MAGDSLRIAIFTDSYFPILNGVSVSIGLLVDGLRKAGHQVHIYTAGAHGHEEKDPNIFRFRSIETPWSKGYPLAYPPFIRMLHRFREHRYDLIHAHTPFTLGFVGLRWAESHEIPIVATYHTLYDRYAHYVWGLPYRYVRFRIAKHTHFYYSNVAHVITPSELSAKWLQRHSVETPTTVVPTGVPHAANIDRTEARKALGIAPDQKVMLYVGRLAREKNLDALYEAAKVVFEREPSARLFLAGDGPERAKGEDHVRQLGIQSQVRFTGFLDKSDLQRHYASADLFTFPSISETQGLVILEAMNYGLPAVAVGGGGASEGIRERENGFVVANDPTQFAEAALEVLQDPQLRAKMSEAALQTARAQSPEQMVERIVGVYRQVLS